MRRKILTRIDIFLLNNQISANRIELEIALEPAQIDSRPIEQTHESRIVYLVANRRRLRRRHCFILV